MKEFLNQLSLIIIYGGIIQGVFFIVLLNSKGVRKSRANTFLSILLLVLSFSVAHILFAGMVINHLSAQINSIGDPTFYLIAPLLWFYACELTGQRVPALWKLLLHFLPFFLVIILSLSLKSVDSEGSNYFLEDHNQMATILFWITVVIQFSWYQIWVRKKWKTYQQLVEQEVSNTENISIAWVRFFLMVFLSINVMFLFGLFAAIHLENTSWLPKVTALMFSLSIFGLGYKGMLQQEIFQTKENQDDKIIPHVPPKEKPDQSRIDQLRAHMEEKKPYLDSELTLTGLAKDLSMTRSQLSLLINEGTGDNFYDFVNKYRVEQVKRLMADPKVKNFNLLGIGLEAGFKSKSTFNLIFKRFTGLTPTEFRKNLSGDHE